jgi:hypothetical protein
MKKLLCLLLLFGLLSGCQPAKMTEPVVKDTPADVYLWEEVGATILLPQGTMEVCDVVVAKDSGAGMVWFQFKDGGDTAFWLKAYAKDTDADSPVPEEQLGVFTLGETDTHIIQVMTSTCGTLNNEEIRPLWEEMRTKVAQMTEEDIMIS